MRSILPLLLLGCSSPSPEEPGGTNPGGTGGGEEGGGEEGGGEEGGGEEGSEEGGDDTGPGPTWPLTEGDPILRTGTDEDGPDAARFYEYTDVEALTPELGLMVGQGPRAGEQRLLRPVPRDRDDGTGSRADRGGRVGAPRRPRRRSVRPDRASCTRRAAPWSGSPRSRGAGGTAHGVGVRRARRLTGAVGLSGVGIGTARSGVTIFRTTGSSGEPDAAGAR